MEWQGRYLKDSIFSKYSVLSGIVFKDCCSSIVPQKVSKYHICSISYDNFSSLCTFKYRYKLVTFIKKQWHFPFPARSQGSIPESYQCWVGQIASWAGHSNHGRVRRGTLSQQCVPLVCYLECELTTA